MVLFIKIEHAAVKGDSLVGVVGVDRFHARATAVIIFIFLDPNLRPTMWVGDVFRDLVLKPGETKVLGDVQIQSAAD
jgi:hypothetical protein